MRKPLYRHLQISCVGFIGVAIGLLAGSHSSKTPMAADHPFYWSADTEAALLRVIPEVDFEGTPFTQAVEKARKLSPVPIVVHWEKLAAAGLDARSPVTFRARNATLGRVLSELVKAIGTAQAHAAYAPAGDAILISVDDDAGKLRDVVVRSYDVRDLLRASADPWEVRDQQTTLYLYQPPGPQPPLPPPQAEDLERLIEETVAPETWRDAGGLWGSLRIFAGRMIVTQTWENHRQIADLLAQLREPALPPAPPRPTPDLSIWNDTLKRYVSTNPAVAETALRRRVPEVRFDRIPLERAIATLAELAQADVVADWTAFETAGAARLTPVSIQLHDETLAEALRALLDVSGAERIQYRIDGGCVILGLPSGDGAEATTRVYDLRGWLAVVMGPPPALFPKNLAEMSAWARLQYSHVESLIKVIEGAVAPDSWKEAGGTIGAIKGINNQLVVTQTWENQERVADLIAAIAADTSRLKLPATAPATRP